MPAPTPPDHPPILDVPCALDLGDAASLVATIVDAYLGAGARVAAQAAALGSAVAPLPDGTAR